MSAPAPPAAQRGQHERDSSCSPLRSRTPVSKRACASTRRTAARPRSGRGSARGRGGLGRAHRRLLPVSSRKTSSSVAPARCRPSGIRPVRGAPGRSPSTASRRVDVPADDRYVARSRLADLARRSAGPRRRPPRSRRARRTGSAPRRRARSPPVSSAASPRRPRAGVDDDHVVGQPLGLVHQVGGEQHRDALVAQPARTRSQTARRACGSSPARGLVEEDHLGPADERAGQGQPLPLATGQPAHGACARSRRCPAGRRGRRPVERTGVQAGDVAQQLAGLARPWAGRRPAASRRPGPGARPRRASGSTPEHAHRAAVRAAQALAALDRWWSCPRRWGRARRSRRRGGACRSSPSTARTPP